MSTHILNTPMVETYRRIQGKRRWCYHCRKKQWFELVREVPICESGCYYGPTSSIECAECRTVDSDLFPGRERVRRFAEAANAVQQHKNDVLGRDTISLPEVERLNLRLHPLYAEMEAAWCALQPGDFGGEGGE